MLFSASFLLLGFGALCSVLASEEIALKLSLPIFMAGFTLFFIDHCVRTAFVRRSTRPNIGIKPNRTRSGQFEDIANTARSTPYVKTNFDERELQAFRIASERLNAETANHRGWLA